MPNYATQERGWIRFLKNFKWKIELQDVLWYFKWSGVGKVMCKSFIERERDNTIKQIEREQAMQTRGSIVVQCQLYTHIYSPSFYLRISIH